MRNGKVLLERYFKWLIDKIKYGTPNVRRYNELLRFLFFKPFSYSLEMDENRVCDGMALRDEFANDKGIIFEYDAECSVLEVLIALSVRCDQNIMGDPEINKESKLFWIMIDNLGLNRMDDFAFDEEYCTDIVDDWMARRIDYDGERGLFPLAKPWRNQKDLEIWVQMQDFLAENFEEDGAW